MANTPHTSAPKGKKVTIHTKDDMWYTGKFVEKKGSYVILDNAKIWAGRIKSFVIKRGKSEQSEESI